jgi:putative ABC transport system substrate-binding protein
MLVRPWASYAGRRLKTFIRRLCAIALLSCAVVIDQSAIAVDSTARVYKLGFLGQTTPADLTQQINALRQGLHDLGYQEGRNLTIEYRWAERKLERLPALATELVEANVDIVVTHGSAGSRAAKNATAIIPIVIAVIGDPVANGVVASLARPGGNVTGLVLQEFETTVRWIELMKDVEPTISRVGLLDVPGIELPHAAEAGRQKEDLAATSLGLQLERAVVRSAEDLPRAFGSLAQRGVQAVIVPNTSLLNPLGAAIAELSIKYRLPTIGSPAFARVGGLLGYGARGTDLYRRAAEYVDKILQGARPAALAMEGPSKFELVANLRTARALGLTFPPTVISQADQLLE